eukprot:scaffold11182_cov122-Isochrysis_galbana.AAC.6
MKKSKSVSQDWPKVSPPRQHTRCRRLLSPARHPSARPSRRQIPLGCWAQLNAFLATSQVTILRDCGCTVARGQ